MILADKIIRLRKKLGWSQEELAERMNVSRQAVSKWENDLSVPDTVNYINLAKIFGVSVEYLAFGEGETLGRVKNLARWKKPAVWAAWGAIIEKRDYLPVCVADMLAISREYDAQWYCAGPVSKKGHPHHPLYLRKDEKIKPFDVKAYLDKL